MADNIEEIINSRATGRDLGVVVYVSGGNFVGDVVSKPEVSPEDVEEAIKPMGSVAPEFSGLVVSSVEIPRGGRDEWPEPLDKGFGVRVKFSANAVDLGDLKEAADMIESRIEAATDATVSGASPDVSIMS